MIYDRPNALSPKMQKFFVVWVYAQQAMWHVYAVSVVSTVLRSALRLCVVLKKESPTWKTGF
ncbi:MAG TPA: hypothetical protein V6D14_07375 [Coleofasciculaceae cyanobacterium]